MDEKSWRQIAIRNNMDWYTAQAQSWQMPFQADADNWWSLLAMPPYHSNLVACGDQPDALIEEIDQALNHTQAAAKWSIKDANGSYALEGAGFEVLFEAQWFARPPSEVIGSLNLDCGHVRRVQNAGEFHRWVDAWGETPPGTHIFIPRLLANPTVQLLFAEREGVMSGGLALNQSTGAVGVSNWFGKPQDVNACLSYAANTFTNVGVVGYEREPDQIRALAELGFNAVGDLRIWMN